MNFPLTHGLNKTGLPLIVITVFDHNLCFLLDTGSNKNIIDQAVYECFKGKIKPSGAIEEGVLTLTGNTRGRVIDLPFRFEDRDYDEPFLCSDATEPFEIIERESGIRIYGILGSNFFLKHGWVIDFEKIEVSSNDN